MSHAPLPLPELPSELIAWLAALSHQPARARSLQGRAVVGELAASLPGFLETTLLLDAPSEAFAQQRWLAQLDQLEQARQGALLLDAAAFPWASAAVTLFEGELARRASAAQAARVSLAQEEDEEQDEDIPQTPLDRAWEVLRELRKLSTLPELDEARHLEAARGYAQELVGEAWVAAFREACASLLPGAPEPDEDLAIWIALALEARLLLDMISGELLAPELFQDIDRVDEILSDLGPALLLLSRDEYDSIVRLGDLPGGWASWRAEHRLDGVESALQAWGEKQATLSRGKLFVSKNPALLDEQLARMSGKIGAQPRLATLEAEAWKAKPPTRPAMAVALAASDDALHLIRQLVDCPQSEQTELLDQLFLTLKKTPCVWLRRDLSAALEELKQSPSATELIPQIQMRLQVRPGNVPLLLAFSGSAAGDLWQLRVSRRQEPGDPWEKSGILLSIARDAVRAAFDAAAACMPHSLPPHSFEEHSIELIGGAQHRVDAIDGKSIGLSAALAFLSLWLDTSIPEDVLCTAAVGSDGSLSPVGFLREKIVLLSQMNAPRLRLLVARSQPTPAVDGFAFDHANSLKEVLSQTNLSARLNEPFQASYKPWLGSVSERLDRLNKYHLHVEQQSLNDYRYKGLNPWMVLGDRIRLIARSLEPAQDVKTRQVVAQAKADAALAFTHAMDGLSAARLLGEIEDKNALRPALQVYTKIIALGSKLDACDLGDSPWEEANSEAKKLEEALAVLPEAEHQEFEGRVLGTIGRVWMHQRNMTDALDYLQRAVESHDKHLPKEAGRSRIYLAMAFRMAGAFDEAAGALEEAFSRIEANRENDASYTDSTALFWSYELARLLLALGRPVDAIAAIEAKMHQARQLGVWPIVGMLRTLAWAAEAAARPDKKQDALRELEPFVPQDRQIARVYQEATGPYREDGEVY